MVNLVEPLFQNALQRSVGGPQRDAPIGEGSLHNSLFNEVLGSGTGNDTLFGGAGGPSAADVLTGAASPALGTPAVPRGGGFLNPLLLGGIGLLQGNNPLSTLKEISALRQKQAQTLFENQLRIRIFQQKQAEFEAERKRLADVQALLNQFADEAEDVGDPNAQGLRLAATNRNPQAAQAIFDSRQNKSHTLTDAELEAEGFPLDAVVERDRHGKRTVVWNPSVDSQEARLKRARATAGASAAREAAKLDRKNIRVFDPGTGKSRFASQNEIDSSGGQLVPLSGSVQPEGAPPSSTGPLQARLAEKLARGETLTAGEQRAADFLARTDPRTIMRREVFAGQSGGQPASPAATAPAPAGPTGTAPSQGSIKLSPERQEQILQLGRKRLLADPSQRPAVEKILRGHGIDPSRL